MSQLWIPKHESFSSTISYLKDRKAGKIKSLLTPWSRLNQAGIRGLEWGNVLTLAARASVGKSLWKDQFVSEAFVLNSNQDFRVLSFEWEMDLITSNVRELGAHLNKSYQYMCSAGHEGLEGVLSDTEIKKCINYFTNKVKKVDNKWDSKIDVILQTLSPKDFEKTCLEYADAHPNQNILITVDHIRLGEKMGQPETEMLYEFAKVFIRLKRREGPNKISFIILTHLNRNILSPERSEEGKHGNYVTDADVMGSDNLMQGTDILIALDCPAQRQIRYYGSARHIIEDDRVLVSHYLKVRNGAKGICFNRALYEEMKIIEIDEPARAVKKTDKKGNEDNNETQGQTQLRIS